MYYLYILYSATKDSYYIGSTSDLVGRLARHNARHKGFTGVNSDWIYVYIESFGTSKEAYERERQVKKWKNRVRIEALIKRNNSVG